MTRAGDRILRAREHAILLDAARACPSEAALTRLRNRLLEPVDWKYLLSIADAHGVSASLLRSLESADAPLPIARLDELRRLFMATTALNLSLTVQLAGVLERLREAGISALAFKGPVLAVTAYGHVGMRSFLDLDILVALDSIEAVRAIMADGGYRLSFREHRIFRVFPRAGKDEFFRPISGGLANIEAHVAIAEWGLSIPFDTRALLERAIHVDVAGLPIRTLSAEDALVVGAVQAMTHHWSLLKHVAEIDAMARARLDWQAVIERARAVRVSRIVAVSLQLARALLGLEVPAMVRGFIEADRDAMTLAADLAATFFVPVEARPMRLAKARLRARSRESAIDRIRYTARAPIYRLACAIVGGLAGPNESA